jgi:hypothetical protein
VKFSKSAYEKNLLLKRVKRNSADGKVIEGISSRADTKPAADNDPAKGSVYQVLEAKCLEA